MKRKDINKFMQEKGYPDIEAFEMHMDIKMRCIEAASKITGNEIDVIRNAKIFEKYVMSANLQDIQGA